MRMLFSGSPTWSTSSAPPRCFVDCIFNLTKFAKLAGILSSDANSRVFVVVNVDTNGMVDKESMRL